MLEFGQERLQTSDKENKDNLDQYPNIDNLPEALASEQCAGFEIPKYRLCTTGFLLYCSTLVQNTKIL